jgi:hypothetical protein
MEAGYVDHRSISGLESSDHGRDLSVSMTATTDAAGNLLIGNFCKLMQLLLLSSRILTLFFLIVIQNSLLKGVAANLLGSTLIWTSLSLVTYGSVLENTSRN